MTLSKPLLSIIGFAFLSACATTNKSSQAWEDLRKSELYRKEKLTYHSRIDGKSPCWGIGLNAFLTANSSKPAEKCLYPNSKFVVGHEGVGQAIKQLQVLQVTPDGFVIKSPDFRNNQVVFIYKTDEIDIVDGTILDQAQNFNLYEYVGTFTYQTLAGPRTVYSFRKFNKKFVDARKDIKYYDPYRDFLIENKAWDHLGEVRAFDPTP